METSEKLLAIFDGKPFTWPTFFEFLDSDRYQELEKQDDYNKRATLSALWREAIVKASSWDTCACGELDDGIEREGHTYLGPDMSEWPEYYRPEYHPSQETLPAHSRSLMYKPVDTRLEYLGIKFYNAVKEKDIDAMKRFFADVQIRGAEVLEEQLEGLGK